LYHSLLLLDWFRFCATHFTTYQWFVADQSGISPFLAGKRVLGLPMRDCARGCNNWYQSRPMMSSISVTAKIFFERLYLVLGLRKIVPWVNCPYAPTTPTVHPTTISRFSCNFFPRIAPHFFVHHDSPNNLSKSRYQFQSNSLLPTFKK